MSSLVKILSGSKVIIKAKTRIAKILFTQPVYSYTTTSFISGMQFEFTSNTNVNIFNESGTLNQTITSGQPLNITI